MCSRPTSVHVQMPSVSLKSPFTPHDPYWTGSPVSAEITSIIHSGEPCIKGHIKSGKKNHVYNLHRKRKNMSGSQRNKFVIKKLLFAPVYLNNKAYTKYYRNN